MWFPTNCPWVIIQQQYQRSQIYRRVNTFSQNDIFTALPYTSIWTLLTQYIDLCMPYGILKASFRYLDVVVWLQAQMLYDSCLRRILWFEIQGSIVANPFIWIILWKCPSHKHLVQTVIQDAQVLLHYH